MRPELTTHSEWNDLPAVESPERREEFVEHLERDSRRIYAAVLTVLGDRTEADDAMQDVCVKLWDKFEEFEPGTNFARWACTIAFYVAKNHYRRRRKERGHGLTDEALARISRVQTATTELLELRRERLRECLTLLSGPDRKFLTECYAIGKRPIDHAKATHQPASTVYTRLERLRRQLHRCIDKHLGRND